MGRSRNPAAGRTRAASVPEKLTLEFAPAGPDPKKLSTVRAGLLRQSAVRSALRGTKHRLVSFGVVDPPKSRGAADPQEYLARIYDYTNERTLDVRGSLRRTDELEVVETADQPPPSPEELADAFAIVREHAGLGKLGRDAQLYAAMPPVIDREDPTGRRERTFAIGLRTSGRRGRHEIVAVNLGRREVTRFDGGAPARALAGDGCGVPPDANQETVQHAPGRVWVTVRRGRVALWRFLAIRPADSSGTNGSAVELKHVHYRGTRVLYQAHVPILNVRYDRDLCGPYRDWQNEEGMLRATGRNVAPGFRLCSQPAQTILESGSDTGNYLGVAIYLDGEELVLVSEMQAGWYRYCSQWRLHADGTIRPRFGFAAVENACVCNVHHHHVYWRLDFDVHGPANNVVREFNDPAIVGSSNWHTKEFEVKRDRDPAHKRLWRVENAQTGQGYTIVPGPDDGLVDPYGKGDLWVLRYHPNEIDDAPTTLTDASAELDRFVNNEPVNGQDLVVWYAAHFTHDVRAQHVGHVVGPDLVPHNWIPARR